MDYKRNQKPNTDAHIGVNSGPKGARAYSDFASPIHKKPATSLPVLLGTATLLPIAALVYYFSQSETRHPIVEKEELSMSDVVSEPNAEVVAPASMPKNLNKPYTASNPAEIARDQQLHEQMRTLREALAREEVEKSKANLKEQARTNWKTEGFDAQAQATLSKNTALWNQQAARDLDAEEIALAKRRMGTFNGTAGDIYAGMNLTKVTTRAPASTGKSCPLLGPRSPDPQCRANYPCRICGACCCGCEAFLAGLSTRAAN